MPNWVSNSINVTPLPNSSATLDEFRERLNSKPDFMVDEERPFSFHMFVTPTDITREEYYGKEITHTNPETGATITGSEGGVWYEWNNENWNTKWDACDSDVDDNPEYICIKFETAWAAPYKVVDAMSRQFPELVFDVWWEEEQGYGAEYTIINGTLNSLHEWDSPDSHAEYVKQGKDCICTWESDEDYWYEDCPELTKKLHIVEVVTKYTVLARDERIAIEVAQAEEGGYDLPERTEVKSVEYSAEYRHVATLESEMETA